MNTTESREDNSISFYLEHKKIKEQIQTKNRGCTLLEDNKEKVKNYKIGKGL